LPEDTTRIPLIVLLS